MKKLDPLQKCIIANEILSKINKAEITAGATVTITLKIKRNGDMQSLEIKDGSAS